MGKLVKTIKTSSKKFLKETDVPVYSEDDGDVFVNTINTGVDDISEYSSDEAPEAVSTTTTKSKIISQLKSEREARRLEKESKRQKMLVLQAQNRQARLNKATLSEEEEEDDDDDSSDNVTSTTTTLAPLPENIFENAIKQQQQKKIRFDSGSDSDDNCDTTLNTEEILETVRLTRAKHFKRNVIKSLPFAVVEVGSNGKARISKAELKARRAISKLKMEKAGSQVRRIDSILDRSRKARSAPVVFHRQNSFY